MGKIWLIILVIIVIGIIGLGVVNRNKIKESLNYVDQKYQEAALVREELLKSFPSEDISVTSWFGNNLGPGVYATASSKLAVSISSDQLLTLPNLEHTNNLTCKILSAKGKSYDIVETASVKTNYIPLKQLPIFSFSKKVKLGGWCSEFANK